MLYYARYEEVGVFVGYGLFLEEEQVLSVRETPFVGTGAPMGGIFGFEMSPNGRFVVIKMTGKDLKRAIGFILDLHIVGNGRQFTQPLFWSRTTG